MTYVVPGMLPIVGDGVGWFHCLSPFHRLRSDRGPVLGTEATMRRVRLAICMHRVEVRWSHNVQFCLKSEVSLEYRGRSRSPVSLHETMPMTKAYNRLRCSHSQTTPWAPSHHILHPRAGWLPLRPHSAVAWLAAGRLIIYFSQ